MINRRVLASTLALTATLLVPFSYPAFAATLDVGPQKPFSKIEDAVAKAQPGDLILVHPREGGQAYERVAVMVRKKNLTFRAAPAVDNKRIALSGQGFNYTGAGSTPRAIFQFDPGADGCLLEGFDLTRAHNDSHNGAGVRINQASRVTIRNCSIHHNDMGIMSNGDGTPSTGLDQRIETCEIHHNGDPAEPGQNHNLYLGGTSVTVSGCEIHHSLTGHNLKSRAHHTRVEYCYLHDSANREFDLVDAADTARPDSDAVLLGNIIVKDDNCPGNRTVIHFGQDGGKGHDGTLHLAFNTIVTPFMAPLIDLSAPGAKARLVGNLVSNGGTRQAGQQIATVRNDAKLESVSGMHNWFSGDFTASAKALQPGLDALTNRLERAAFPLFRNPAKPDYSLTPEAAKMAVTPLSREKIELPPVPGRPAADTEPPLSWQYHHPAGKTKRPAEPQLTLGAYTR